LTISQQRRVRRVSCTPESWRGFYFRTAVVDLYIFIVLDLSPFPQSGKFHPNRRRKKLFSLAVIRTVIAGWSSREKSKARMVWSGPGLRNREH
jgi:hypothetical protein